MKPSSIAILLIFSTLVGCSTQTKISQKDPIWLPETITDSFTDEKRCLVTVAQIYIDGIISPNNPNYYPFIERRNGTLRVGIKSGVSIKIPTGDFQIRIDSNPSWSITTAETPIDKEPLPIDSSAYTKNLPKEQKEMIEQTFRNTAISTAKSMSEFTSATGEKADSILNQLLSGSFVIYQKTLFSKPFGSIQKYSIDSSLPQALKYCNIL